jgi:cytochrome c biogenesis protein CcmG/thiol:disulfide interchange protein DsbE
VLVNFWASWCEPCRTEAPALERLHRAHPDRFTVLGINLDDNTADATEFVEKYGLTYPQLRDGDGRGRRDAYGMTGFPESFLIDPEGDVAVIRRGPVDEAYLAEFIEPVLSGAAEPR